MAHKTMSAVHVMVICFIFFVSANASDYAVVKKDFAKILLYPYGDAQQSGLAKKGNRYKIMIQQGDWFSIEHNGSEGWIYSANITVEHEANVIDSSPKPNPPKKIPDIKKETAFSVVDTKPKKKPSSQPIPTALVKADPVENITPEIIAATDSLQKSRAKKAAQAQGYFAITQSPTKILKALNPQSPILGIAKKNDVFPLIYAGASWCKIVFKNDTGWVETSRGEKTNSAVISSEKMPGIILITLISGSFLLILIFAIIFVVVNSRRQKFKKHSLKRDVLIISRGHKELHYSLTDITTTLPKCFAEIGFKVSVANDLEHAETLLAHYAPDLIVVDWELEKNIQTVMATVVSGNNTNPSLRVIFFNVPDPTETSKRNKIPNMFFLGLVFSDRDIFKIVTPLIMAAEPTRTVRKSVQTSALEGDIRLGNLMEVLQFIEIGKKTGCLYITINSPHGLIYFEQGRITYAATQQSQGKEAVFAILDLKEGHFHLVLDKVSPSKNVNLSTLEVLMDWTKVKDEALRS